MNRKYLYMPIGWMTLMEENGLLCRIIFGKTEEPQHSSPVLEEAARQIAEYFSGLRKSFSVPVRAEGTRFQQVVWEEVRKIPYGELRTYKEIAEAIGLPKNFRAVETAGRRNPLPLIIPCHRVVGRSRAPAEWGTEPAMREFLLCLEGADEYPE